MNISKIIQMPLPASQYHAIAHPKKQIVVHHTASGPSAEGVINYWKSDKDRVATAFVIDGDGDVYQCFSSAHYASHLGVKATDIKILGFKDYATRCDTLHRESIGIEICNWGGLTKDFKGRWVSYAGVVVPPDQVQEYPNGFRGYKAYQKYTPAQIAALKYLLIYLCDKYKITKEYRMGDFTVSKLAIGGNPGIYTHCNYRPASEKQDLAPQPDLVNTLKFLTK